jgi:hypothetical protein
MDIRNILLHPLNYNIVVKEIIGLHESCCEKSTACYLLHTGFLLGLFFDHEDESSMFL